MQKSRTTDVSYPDYQEPQVSFAVLDMAKPLETRILLESLRARVRFPHKVIYLHNGPSDYAYQFYRDGLVDHFIQTRANHGLGVGTRDLFAASFSPYTIYVQNDQVLVHDFTQEMLNQYVSMLSSVYGTNAEVKVGSISLAGPVGGQGIYSERAHIISTSFYKAMDTNGLLPTFGAGPYHHGMWREEVIQRYYKTNGLIHLTHLPPIFKDNGVWSIRDCAGGRVKMRTDTKGVTWLTKPTHEYVFPDHTPDEWRDAINGDWQPGRIPVGYLNRGESFNCWGNVE